MPLTNEQLMALVASFEVVATARIDRLTLTVGYVTDTGECIDTTQTYQLESVYPERDVPRATETRNCVSCHADFVSIEDRTLCWACDTEGEDFEYGE